MKPSWKRDAGVFLSAQTLSLLGSSLVQYALMWTVTLKTGSGLMMTAYIVAGFLPAFFMAPFGGVWADRFDRRRLIMIADGAIALVTLGLALAYALGQGSILAILIAAAFRSLGSAVHGPAVGAFLPQIVPQESLARVNGINGSIQAALMLVSPVASAALMSFMPLAAIFMIDVATALMAIGVLAFFLKVPAHPRAREKLQVPWFRDMALGLKYIRSHRYLVPFFLYVAGFLFLVAPAAFLTPLQVKRSFGEQVWRLMAIEIAFSGGMMAGGALVAAWGGLRNRVGTMVLSSFAMASCTLALGLIPLAALDPGLSFGIYLAVFALFGIALPFYNTPSTVLLQEHVEDAYLGRVFSVMTMISTSMMPLGMLLFGPLAELVKIEWILVGTGILMALAALLVPFNRPLVEAGRRKAA